MARKNEPDEDEMRFGMIRPMYEDALQNYMLKSGMLANVVSTVLTIDARAAEVGQEPMAAPFREKLEKALADFMKA